MSCMVAALQGGNPTREIFPISTDRMVDMQTRGSAQILGLLGVKKLSDIQLKPGQHIGAALKPDGTAFYLTTIAPDFGLTANPVGQWRGGFCAPFGVADVVGIVEGDLAEPGAKPTTIRVKARLVLDAGGNALKSNRDAKAERGGTVLVSVDWEIRGSQATRPNKAALIASVTINDCGPHDSADIRRCVALHAPQRSFGEPRAIIAMQCGVAAACLLEAIC